MKLVLVILLVYSIHASKLGCENPPDNCFCSHELILHCKDVDAFPESLPSGVNELIMENCNIQTINKLLYPELLELLVIKCNVEDIADDAFALLTKVTKMELSSNSIDLLRSEMFRGLGALTHLSLADNKFEEIPPKLFTMLPKLETLTLSSNPLLTLTETTFEHVSETLIEFSYIACDLQVIPTAAFAFMQGLQTLRLNQNTFPKVDDHAFKVLHHLNILELDSCSIASISKESFDGLNNLKELKLGNNKLKNIDSDAFDHVSSTMKTVDLQENKFTNLPNDLLKWNNMEKVGLSGNSWTCDCDMAWISQTNILLGLSERESVLCASPPDVLRHTVLNATSSLECETKDNGSAVALGIAIPIIIICVVLIGYFVYKIIQGRRRKVQRNSVRYSAVYRDTTEAKNTEVPPNRPTSEL